MVYSFFIALLWIFFSVPEEKPKEKPNIVLILADDLGWSDIGCYGSEVETPNLDWLAKNGVRFTQMYNTSKCNPSRAALLTGLYAQQVGYEATYQQPLKNGITLGELLQSAGYRTLWAGKHHGGDHPMDRGFDRYYGFLAFDAASGLLYWAKSLAGAGEVARAIASWMKSRFDYTTDLSGFVRVEGDGVHEIAVGPVHAGIIEPGHFRFSVVGEKVLRLEQHLGV